MCGIAGVLYRDRQTLVNPDLLQAMTDMVRHRGPDGEGLHIAPGLGLGHRRLSIIDPAAGQQPMMDAETQNIIVYNGEVFNYVEIRAELTAAGHRFRTDSDTEVILKAYAQWGARCLDRFNGMWAFAIWDHSHKRLFLARDRLGIKPLHYCVDAERIVFASEIKSLFAAGVPRMPDTSLLDVYLTFGYIPAPHSFFSGVRKLLPGQYLITDGERTEIRRYWDLPAIAEGDMRRDAVAVQEEFAYLLGDAVRISMRSDVPFGAFLSGGLDSASVVTLMAEQTRLPVETFTIGFDDPVFDERRLARLVSARVNTRHHEAVVSPDDLQTALHQVAFHYDEPFGDSSALPTSHVARLAARHVKMVLTGDGGDEVLSGYPAYQVEKLAGSYLRIPRSVRRCAEVLVGGVAGMTRGHMRYTANRYYRLLTTTAAPFEDRLLAKIAWLEEDRRRALLAGLRVHRAKDVFAELMRDCPYRDSFYRLMYFNYKVSLPDDMLTKVDRMTMAWSLEARVPFLDYRLVELMSVVHKDVKLPGLTRKAVLRKTVARKLPEALLAAGKRGFVAPLRSWFRQGDFADSIVKRSVAMTGLSGPVVDQILAEQRAGQRDYGNLLWMLMVLGAVKGTAETPAALGLEHVTDPAPAEAG
jgi:asparagine synthase (glutamine-hydrolysing)